MRFSMTGRLAFALLFAILVFNGCEAGFGKKQTPVEDRDFVAEARAALQQIKAQHVLLTGLYAVAEQKADELLYVPGGLRLRRIKWRKFHAELNGCWTQEIQNAENPEQRDVQISGAAKHFNDRKTPRHEIQLVQDVAFNVVNQVSLCDQTRGDNVVGVSNRAREDVKLWAYDRLTILNELRALLKKDLPARAAAVTEAANTGPGKIAALRAEADKHTKTLKDRGTPEQRDSHARQLKLLERIEADMNGIKDAVSSEASTVPDKAEALSVRVTESLSRVGK